MKKLQLTMASAVNNMYLFILNALLVAYLAGIAGQKPITQKYLNKLVLQSVSFCEYEMCNSIQL